MRKIGVQRMGRWFDASCGTGDLRDGGYEGNDEKIVDERFPQTFMSRSGIKKGPLLAGRSGLL